MCMRYGDVYGDVRLTSPYGVGGVGPGLALSQ